MTTADSTGQHTLAAEIASATAHIYHEALGKGPTKVRAYLQRDVVLVVLEDIYNIAERTLIDAGQEDDVIQMRLRMQGAVRSRYIDAIQRLVGRKVRAYLSQNHVDPDVAVEVFLLEPATSTNG